MLRTILTTTFFLFLTYPLFSQNTLKVKAQPVPIQDSETAHKALKNAESYQIDGKGIYSFAQQNRGKSFIIELKIDENRHWKMELQASKVLGEEFDVHTNTGDEIDVEENITYKGILKDHPETKVRLTIAKNLIHGIIFGKEIYSFETINKNALRTNNDLTVFYKTSENQSQSSSCGHESVLLDHNPSFPLDQINDFNKTDFVSRISRSNNKSMNNTYCPKLSVVLDHQGLDVAGSVDNFNADLQTIVNIANGYYDDFSVEYVIHHVEVIESSPNPWPDDAYNPNSNTNNREEHLTQNFREWAYPNLAPENYNCALLFTGLNMNGIGYAFFGHMCPEDGYRYGEIDYQYNQTITQRANITTHELGHLWDARHGPESSTHVMSPRIWDGDLQWTSTSFDVISNSVNNTFNSCLPSCTVNCDPYVDNDNDGYCSDVDCDDNDSTVHPDATEMCDGIDNNCNGSTDEGTCTYCEATGADGTTTDYISNVSIGSINNTSGQSDYSDYSSQISDVIKGQSYALEIKLNNVFTSDQAYAWVDWNDDKIFDNSTELVQMGDYNSSDIATGTVTVPQNAVLGLIRLRTRNIYADPNTPEACGDIYGEVEDYTLNVLESNTYCSATGADGTTTDYISNVSIGDISNASQQTDYSDFTSISTEVTKGQSYTLQIQLNNVFTSDRAYAWVDWDDDKSFNNSTELISMSAYNSSNIATGTITVPQNTVLGPVRLRTRNIYADPNTPEACGDIYGEVEDYTLTVFNPSSTCDDHELSLEIQLDDYPDETSWQIVDAGGTIVASGGTYDGQQNELVVINLCLSEGCYDFIIYDEYEDGICCDYGNGNYLLTDLNGQVLASGGEFNASETTNFCLGSGNCNEELINSADFESGWGSWNDGGVDARRNANDASFASSGTYCIRLRDNTDESVITSDDLDLSRFSEITIDFSYRVESFENTEDFWLQLSTDGGLTFSTIEDWVRTIDFENDERHNPSVRILGPFSNTTQLRFRCDASGNGDKVYIDDVIIEGCSNHSANTIAFDRKDTSIDGDDMETEAIGNFDSLRKQDQINFYPNPVYSELTVEFESIEQKKTQIELYDINGRTVLSQSIEVREGHNQIRLNLEELSSGVYLLSISNSEKRITKQVVILR